ncbi:MAG: ParB/RepB/Spo0J family partition protein [Hyphomicrobiaceae bacterium]
MSGPMQRGRLGRGLASLIGDPTGGHPERLPAEGEQRLVSIEQIRSSSLNPRQTFDDAELDELAASIRERGLVQPIIARPVSGGGFEIVAGERRWRASQRAGLQSVPVIVRELNDKEVLELAIIENVQRADLNAIDEARGYRELIDRFGYNQDELAQIIGKSRSHLANTVRLLKLPERVQQLMQEGRLSAGHGRALVGRDDAEKLAETVVAKGLSVREVEALVQLPLVPEAPRQKREKDPDTQAFERELTEALGLKVEVKRGSNESGVLTVRFRNYDQLDYVKMRLLGSGQ